LSKGHAALILWAALSKLHAITKEYSWPPQLVFCGSHAGVSIGEDGPSQMGLEDIAMFRALIKSRQEVLDPVPPHFEISCAVKE